MLKYVFIAIILLIVFIFVYPFKVKVHNESNYLYINISNFVVFKLNMLMILDKLRNNQLDRKFVNNKLITKIDFKAIEINISGLNSDYKVNGAYYGLICSIFGFIRAILNQKEINFDYNLSYLGDEYVEFKTIARTRVYSLLKAINKI